MNRRRFIKLAAMAAGALGLAARTPEPEPKNLISNGDMIHSLNSYNVADAKTIINDRGDYHGLWTVDPTCPPDMIYAYSPREFADDSRMFHEFARFEFRQREMWPQSARITHLAAPGGDDAI